MIKILFNRSNKANLPEIDAYIKYFNNTKDFRAYDSSNIPGEIDYDYFDILWEFKGVGGMKTNKNQLLIHEYASLSTGILPKLKNKLKVVVNKKPHYRIFLNESVKRGYNFSDGIQSSFRDMGIDQNFINIKPPKKEFDFIYIGAINKGRKIDELLEMFKEKKNSTICLIGQPEDNIYEKYRSNKNIIFTGKVPYQEVPIIASKAEYGINYIPDIYPYNVQTSTKLLEYLALGLKVITTDYFWVRQFEKKYECSFFYLKDKRFDIEKIEGFDYDSNIPIEDFLWDRVIEKSNISDKLLSIYKA